MQRSVPADHRVLLEGKPIQSGFHGSVVTAMCVDQDGEREGACGRSAQLKEEHFEGLIAD